MKCDELKAEQWLDYSGEPMPCYPKAKVDEAIAELKRKLQDQCISCPVKMQEDDVVAEKDNEIRRLQHALWLARLRSLRHFSVLAYFQTIRAKGKESNMDFDEMAYRINLACVKCRMKAEEYN